MADQITNGNGDVDVEMKEETMAEVRNTQNNAHRSTI